MSAPAEDDLITSFGSIAENDNYKNFLVKVPGDTTDAGKLKLVLDAFAEKGGLLTRHYMKGADPNPNAAFPTTNLDPKNRLEYIGDMNQNNFVQVLDFRKIRSKLQKAILDVTSLINEIKEDTEEELNKALQESLGFNPTIKDVFRIICNNTQSMLSTIYGVTAAAEAKDKQSQRNKILKSKAYTTDIPTDNKTAYAWPRIFKNSEDKGSTEIYPGAITTLNTKYFPEVPFVDQVFDNIVSKREELKKISDITTFANGLDNDNWYPINPLDYKTNPFVTINALNTAPDIIEELAKQLFLRTTLLNTYSHFTDLSGGKIEDYATMDGISANWNIVAQTPRDIIKTNLNENNIKLSAVKNNMVYVDSKTGYPKEFEIPLGSGEKYYKLNEDKFKPQIGPHKISGDITSTVGQDDISYILLNESDIVNNSENLIELISDNDIYKNIQKKKNDPNHFSRSYYSNNNYTSVIFYNVWSAPMCDLLLNKNLLENPTQPRKKYRIPDLTTLVDIGGEYINVLNPNKGTDTTAYEKFLTDTKLYINQTGKNKRYCQALLLLSTLPFKSFEKGILDILTKSKSCRVMGLPTYYLYYIGGLLWRYTQPDSDGIDWQEAPKLKTEKNYYFGKLGSHWKTGQGTDTVLEKNITNLPKKTREKLIDTFTNWVVTAQDGFQKFETAVKDYKSNNPETGEKHGNAVATITSQLEDETDMILPAPMVFFPDDISAENLKNGLIIKVKDFDIYVKKFKQQFIETDKKNKKDNKVSGDKKNIKSNISEDDIKLQIYNYFKNINDKWVSDNDSIFNACGSEGKNLIDYFKFIDRGWSDIGEDAVINLNSLLTLSNSLDSNVYFFISKILRDSNFLLQILPNFINYQDATEISEMFMPISNVSSKNRSSGPIYACIYAGGVSEVLDIGEENKYYFANDGFGFHKNTLPSDYTNPKASDAKGEQFSLVAFRVAFGSQNQTVFKNVSLSQQEHRETAEYFQVLAELIDKRGGTQRSYKGNDLLRLFKTRSYSCKVDALGCMNIQPLMYFDLQNVPFFNGAYLITNVNHNITPNHMTTNFTGLRQSKYVTSYVDKPTVFLNINLNEDLNLEASEFTNLATSDPIFIVGIVDEETADGTFEGLTLQQLEGLGVNDADLTEEVVEEFNDIMTLPSYNNNIITNSQATMFLANLLSNSEYMKNKGQTWDFDVKFEEEYKVRAPVVPPTTPPTTKAKEYGNGDIVFNPPGTPLQETFKNDGSQGDWLGNVNDGDAYRWKPRGYIYMNGKKRYKKYFPDSYFLDPNSIEKNTGESMINAFQVAAKMWSHDMMIPGNLKTCNEVAKGEGGALGKGNAASFQRTFDICQQYKNSPEDAFKAFEKVLNAFSFEGKPLISYSRGN